MAHLGFPMNASGISDKCHSPAASYPSCVHHDWIPHGWATHRSTRHGIHRLLAHRLQHSGGGAAMKPDKSMLFAYLDCILKHRNRKEINGHVVCVVVIF